MALPKDVRQAIPFQYRLKCLYRFHFRHPRIRYCKSHCFVAIVEAAIAPKGFRRIPIEPGSDQLAVAVALADARPVVVVAATLDLAVVAAVAANRRWPMGLAPAAAKGPQRELLALFRLQA